MSKIKLVLSVVVILFAFVNCDPSENNANNNFNENFGSSVSRDFIGRVVDANNHPIQNVSIKIGSSTVQTDINGVFIINNASVNQKFAYITAKKAGYVDGSRAMVPTLGKNNVRIMLLQDTPLQTIQSGVTSEVSIYSGTKVIFDGAFMDENGAAYSGAVAVSMFHLTPSDANISELMPGMLLAQDENGQAKVLQTFGMLHVELHGSNGQKLQIATGHTAQITMRIDDSQLATCPATIPLWHFDEQNGYWKQEGSATKSGNYYVGNVSHFSWWNCDTFLSTTNLTVTIVDSNGNPLANVGVSLVVNSSNFNSYVQYTDINGQVSGVIPKNQTLTLNVHNNNCGIIFTSNIGPFSSDTILPNTTISINSTSQVTVVEGTLRSCDNSLVVSGYVLFNESMLYPVSAGNFSFNALYCSSNTNFTLKGVDFDNLQQTDLINCNFTPTLTNVGNLPACNSVNEFISYQLDNDAPKYILNYLHGITLGGMNLGGSNGGPSGVVFNIYGTATVPGVYTTNQFSINGYDVRIGSYSTNNTVLFHLNNVGNVGEYIDMTFKGTYLDTISSVQVTRSIKGIAHVLRDN